MAKRKQRKPRKSKVDLSTQKGPEQAQAANLKLCEDLGDALPSIEGVPVAKALTYELNQFLNVFVVQQTEAAKNDKT